MKKSVLNDDSILNQLEELAASLQVEVRYEKLKKESSFYPGGLCRIKGENVLIINSLSSPEDRIQTFMKAVKSFDLSRVFIRPALRELISAEEE